MNNILIFSDLHITQSSIKECISVLEEIGMLANKYNCDTLIDLGDTFDNLKPNSLELDAFATFIRRLNKKIIILTANSHESETEEKSILNHYGILSDNVQIVKEYRDSNHLLCIHASTKESPINFDAKHSYKEYNDFIYVFAGHIHSYYVLKPNFCGLGSCRYINFDETKDKQKIVALITDYNTETEKVHFMKLKLPIPMVQIELGKNDQNKAIEDDVLAKKDVPTSSCVKSEEEIEAYLDQLDPKTKVKVKILDFESFRQFLPLVNRYSNKFSLFKYETNFTVISDINKEVGQTELISFKESFMNWLKNQKIDEKIKEILLKEINA